MLNHPFLASRRTAIQAGSIGLLGLGMNHLSELRTAHAAPAPLPDSERSCIFIFLSGGLAQQDSFDLKPDAPDSVRGEFRPIRTNTPGIDICEHLPMLATRSHLWSLCRSVTHSSNEHSAGHHIMLTGRSELPPGFNASKPLPTDRPSIAALAGYAVRSNNNLPSSVMLPEKLVHNSKRVIPGQFAGELGSRHDPWLIEASPFHSKSYGAFPEYDFDHQERGGADARVFQAPHLTLPHGLTEGKLAARMDLLKHIEKQRRDLDRHQAVESFDKSREGVLSLLADDGIKRAFDVTRATDAVQLKYGRNSFGWSLLMARRLVETGVKLVQVNLGNDETWDTHGNAFPHLKNKLFPPTDQAVSALLDDLHESGQLENTLVVMAGEFGRTPKISLLERHYEQPGRDHWGAVQSIFLAGGGIKGGRVVGASDAHAGFPVDSPQRPENFAATIYESLGIPPTAVWKDAVDRPHSIYYGDPISGLT